MSAVAVNVRLWAQRFTLNVDDVLHDWQERVGMRIEGGMSVADAERAAFEDVRDLEVLRAIGRVAR